MQRRALERLDHPIKILLLVVSVATILALAFAALQENVFSEWDRLQRRYVEILKDKAVDEPGQNALRDFELGIKQNYLPALAAVDRCVTCHVGAEDPRMAQEEQPFRTHPGRYLEIHTPDKFGCTVCHEGQGRATARADAHGHTAHWDSPLLPSALSRSRCTKCHVEHDLYGEDGLMALADRGFRATEGAALMEQGRALFWREGCLGCHRLRAKGGQLGPDLTTIGAKHAYDFDFSHLQLDDDSRRVVHEWLTRHFLEPQSVSPGSLMPAIRGGEDAAMALTAYTLAQGARRPHSYDAHVKIGASDAPAMSGAELFGAYCSACHGSEGQGGTVADVHTPALNTPATLVIADDNYYRYIITNGRSGTMMPSWGAGRGNLTPAEVDKIVDHVRGWQPAGPNPVHANSSAGDTSRGEILYEERGCMACHGWDGEGGIGGALGSQSFLAVADDRLLAETIVHGRPGTAMPAGNELSEQDLNDILAFIRTWQASPPTFSEVVGQLRSQPRREQLKIGRAVYERSCRACHGEHLEGGIGPSLGSDDFLRVVDDMYLYRAITEGRTTTAMPAWRELSVTEVAGLIALMRSYQDGDTIQISYKLGEGDHAIGEIHYNVACRSCHGEAGIGRTAPQIANRTFLDSASDGILNHWIAHGHSGTGMKGFAREEQGPVELKPTQIADVIAYLRHSSLQPRKGPRRNGLGDPRAGAGLFRGHCASCHGRRGEGTMLGPQLNNPTLLHTASDGFLAATIVLGRSGTPMKPMVLGSESLGQLAPDHVQDIIAYMRSWEDAGDWPTVRDMTEMSEQAISQGADAYARYCAPCHGEDGKGKQGRDVEFAPALNNREFLRAASDGFLIATIVRGRAGTPMPAFGEGAAVGVQLEATQITNIVSYMRSWEDSLGPVEGRPTPALPTD